MDGWGFEWGVGGESLDIGEVGVQGGVEGGGGGLRGGLSKGPGGVAR